MKALVYKDLRIIWRDMKGLLLFYTLVCSVPLGILSGELEELIIGCVVFPAFGIPIELKRRDAISGWQVMERTLPYTTWQIVGSKYVISGLTMLWGLGLYCLGRAVFFRVSFASADWKSDLFLTALLVVLDAIFMVSLYFAEGDLGVDLETFFFVMLIPIGLLFALPFGPLDFLYTHQEALLAAPLLWLLSIPVSVRICENKRGLRKPHQERSLT